MYSVPDDATEATAQDLATIAEQIGRLPRGVVGIAARCACGRPLVARTAPRLPDGTPFPTMYYLTSPAATEAVSRLEAAGAMRDLNEFLAGHPGVARRYARAHEAYLAERAQLGVVEEIAGVSAGGMPERIKCLHALVAHALARPGVNPIGDEVLRMLKDTWCPDRCAC